MRPFKSVRSVSQMAEFLAPIHAEVKLASKRIKKLFGIKVGAGRRREEEGWEFI